MDVKILAVLLVVGFLPVLSSGIVLNLNQLERANATLQRFDEQSSINGLNLDAKARLWFTVLQSEHASNFSFQIRVGEANWEIKPNAMFAACETTDASSCEHSLRVKVNTSSAWDTLNFSGYELTVFLPKSEKQQEVLLFVNYTLENFISDKNRPHYLALVNYACNGVCPTQVQREFRFTRTDSILERIPDDAELNLFDASWSITLRSSGTKFIQYSNSAETDFLTPFVWSLVGALLGAGVSIFLQEFLDMSFNALNSNKIHLIFFIALSAVAALFLGARFDEFISRAIGFSTNGLALLLVVFVGVAAFFRAWPKFLELHHGKPLKKRKK